MAGDAIRALARTADDLAKARHKFSQRGIRCPMLRPDPAQLPRLVEIEINTRERLQEARQMQWLGEVAGLQDSLRHIADKKRHAERLRQLAVDSHDTDNVLR